ncbi:hypothetical protein POTOM_054891 [Populus tomentosa]|uniref:UBL3-like ubiquitin domain-containing protein n=1 Tax=Populus tomentosa TaxID=118781 RepID=A0A8X7Y3A6_POPTO|nr:hypothetical protein POTOM_054891 [Populus tomentosa]
MPEEEEEEEELVELKFRLYDGSDIGPFRYPLASPVAMLKERIVADWPKDYLYLRLPTSQLESGKETVALLT